MRGPPCGHGEAYGARPGGRRVWGADYAGDTKTLDVHIKRLRAKIEPVPSTPRFITVRGLGYKFEPDE
jgi:DNA-binding response OmpR family regulator